MLVKDSNVDLFIEHASFASDHGNARCCARKFTFHPGCGVGTDASHTFAHLTREHEDMTQVVPSVKGKVLLGHSGGRQRIARAMRYIYVS